MLTYEGAISHSSQEEGPVPQTSYKRLFQDEETQAGLKGGTKYSTDSLDANIHYWGKIRNEALS